MRRKEFFGILLLALFLALPGLGRLGAWREGSFFRRLSPGTESSPALAAPLSPAPEGEENTASPILAAYYPWYGQLAGFLPGDIPAEGLTHLHYAFAGVDEDGQVVLENPREDTANFAGFRELREEHSGLRTLLSIGGWDWSKNFSTAARDETHRRAFAQSAADLMEEHGFDGLDLDWEFPVFGGKEGNLHDPADGENYVLLLRAVREELDARGNTAGREHLLTAAVPPGEGFLQNVPLGELSEPVDYLFLMGYDRNGPWDELTGMNAPLSSPVEGWGIDKAVETYLSAGVSPEKLVLGVPFYGYLYHLTEDEPGRAGMAFSSGESVGYDTIVSQYLEEGQRNFDSLGQVPWLSGEGWFLSYDDPSSIAAKGRFAREKGLGGAGAWELSQDREGRLLSALRGSINAP